jgi:SAM-dependent methyltransferase
VGDDGTVTANGNERYDKRYFDRWYRREGFGSRARLERRVQFALSNAEFLLDRPVRSVLDVGCGEGQWQPALRRSRPRARYVGVDPSKYAVERFGVRRNLRLGSLGTLHELDLDGPFDLVVCVDVLGYPSDRDVRRGLAAIAGLLGGVAFLEAFTTDDHIEGDVDGYRLRRPGTYARWCTEAGLHRVGPHLYVGARLLPTLAALERPVVGKGATRANHEAMLHSLGRSCVNA